MLGREGDARNGEQRWRGHPINPQQAASYPLYKVIFLVPALSRVRAPSKFPTIDRTTRDHCHDQSALGLLRKAQYEFHVSIKSSSSIRYLELLMRYLFLEGESKRFQSSKQRNTMFDTLKNLKFIKKTFSKQNLRQIF